MRILVYGAGAIGCLFAGKLAQSGADVTLLARGSWKETLERDGLVLEDCLNGALLRLRPRIIGSLAPDDAYDYVLVVMQAAQVAAVLPVLAANRSPNIVFVVNNPLGYGEWQRAVGAERVMVGFPSAGGERRDGRRTERLAALAALFRRAGFAPALSRDMASWQRTHVAVILAIGRALYRFDSDNYRLARSWGTLRRMVLATREGFRALGAMGCRVTPAKLNFYRLPTWLLVPVFSLLLRTRMAEFAMARHTIAAKDEIRLLEEQFRGWTAAGGTATPNLDAL